MDDKAKISNGPNDRPRNESIAGTGPGIPDDARGPGEEELPEAPTEEDVERAKAALGVTGKGENQPLERQ
jgi:hypothetical protein